jgi:hypothetical protein
MPSVVALERLLIVCREKRKGTEQVSNREFKCKFKGTNKQLFLSGQLVCTKSISDSAVHVYWKQFVMGVIVYYELLSCKILQAG